MIPKSIVFCLIPLLAACATEQNYNTALDHWVGQSESALISAWGVPDKQYDAGGGVNLFAYVSGDAVSYDGMAPMCQVRSVDRINAYADCTGGFSPVLQTLRCETTFTVDRGVVSAWTHRGNDCVL
jgi:hypothetical protein